MVWGGSNRISIIYTIYMQFLILLKSQKKRELLAELRLNKIREKRLLFQVKVSLKAISKCLASS